MGSLQASARQLPPLPPQRQPLVLACYYEGPARSSDWVRPQDEAVLAELARLAAAALT